MPSYLIETAASVRVYGSIEIEAEAMETALEQDMFTVVSALRRKKA